MNARLRRILLVRNDRVGDLVLALPGIAALRQALPQAHLTALVSSYAGPLLAGSRLINELLVDDPADSATQLARRLRPHQFDTALVFNTNTRNALAVWQARIPQRVCWAYKPAGWLLGNRRVNVRRSHPPIHETQFVLAFVRRLGIPAELPATLPRLEIDVTTRRHVADVIARDLGTSGPLFGVHPGSKNSAYNWPPHCYGELIGRLAQHGRVMVTGSPAEESLLEGIRGRLSVDVREHVRFYTGFQLLQLAAVIERLTSLTVSSTGPMHLAGILGTPLVGLFSPHPAHAPAKWAPLGDRQTLLLPPLDAGEDPRIGPAQADEVMSRISVDAVLRANLKYANHGLADTALGRGELAA